MPERKLTLNQARQEQEILRKKNPGIVYSLQEDDKNGWKVEPLTWSQIGPTIVGGLPGMDFGAELPEIPPPPDWKGPK